MSYETIGGQVTRSITYAKLIELLKDAQECSAVMAHLHNTEGNLADTALANGWLLIAENLRRMQFVVTKMAQGRLN